MAPRNRHDKLGPIEGQHEGRERSRSRQSHHGSPSLALTAQQAHSTTPTQLVWKRVKVLKDGRIRFGVGLRRHPLGYEVVSKEDHVSLAMGEIILACAQHNLTVLAPVDRSAAMAKVLDDPPDSVWMIVASEKELAQVADGELEISDSELCAFQVRVRNILESCAEWQVIRSEWHHYGVRTQPQERERKMPSLKRLWQQERNSSSKTNTSGNVTGHWKIVEETVTEYIWFQADGDSTFCGYQLGTLLPCFGRVRETSVHFEVWTNVLIFQATAELRKHSGNLQKGTSIIDGCTIPFTGVKVVGSEQDAIVPWLLKIKSTDVQSRPEEELIELEAGDGIAKIGMEFSFLPPEASSSSLVGITANSWAQRQGLTANSEIMEVNGLLPRWLYTWHDLQVQMQKRPLKLKVKMNATDMWGNVLTADISPPRPRSVGPEFRV